MDPMDSRRSEKFFSDIRFSQSTCGRNEGMLDVHYVHPLNLLSPEMARTG